MNDLETKRERIVEFIRKKVKEAKADGIVIGLSGGIDSALVAKLCVDALNGHEVLALVMPTKFTPKEDKNDAIEFAKSLGIEWKIRELDEIVDVLDQTVGVLLSKLSKGNMTTRLRMIFLYAFANQFNYLVAGTSDKSENFLGYFTKWGDGAVDFEPIIHLTKTEVRELAKFLEIPNRIVNKPSSPRLWKDHNAEKELGVSYKKLDKLLDLNKKTKHKRRVPSSLEEN